ncbi:sulfite exporter TauE/SafE family protein [Halomonas denitrificans]|uniref:sulfite exporter TauE/SafE family protein n=1 Tax=Halomonas TaxID=2745 RepID=UPI001C96C9ED|nr:MULTISPECIES: sulfite exporter TauE/SafE family protein [Halomonas]MBY5929840.1 sulfite exporter TauE/SafE family protein [Halomonas sp. DP8Y7-3]MBY5968410.1 sulfite exporter TauE/SafE family protein [Halomonas denitrificans]MBY6028204.1 sulfite exporter TauE/SafE family protein [Halomonas sp. DP8Y7-1]MCA0975281.1 sulfite exporter TauE/SafE family protein [Halomonas denitrificans]
MLMAIMSYLALGAVAGALAGLYGVGGGLIIVPSLMAVFALQQVPAEISMHLAVGTSLASIVITGSSSALGHYRRGSIRRDWLVALLPGLVLGAIAGVFVAGALSGGMLGTLFGVFLLLVALKLVLGRSPKAGSSAPGRRSMIVAGGVIGGISALFGIGGGTLSVPWLIRCGATMTQAVGTSAACGLPIALVGALTFVAVGWGDPRLPQGAVGFLMLPALFGIALTSVPCARLGVRLAHRLPARVLKLSFALLLTVVGLGFLL